MIKEEWIENELFSSKVYSFLFADFLYSHIQLIGPMPIMSGRVYWPVSFQKDRVTFALSRMFTESRDFGKWFIYFFQKKSPISPNRTSWNDNTLNSFGESFSLVSLPCLLAFFALLCLPSESFLGSCGWSLESLPTPGEGFESLILFSEDHLLTWQGQQTYLLLTWPFFIALMLFHSFF